MIYMVKDKTIDSRSDTITIELRNVSAYAGICISIGGYDKRNQTRNRNMRGSINNAGDNNSYLPQRYTSGIEWIFTLVQKVDFSICRLRAESYYFLQ